MIPCPCPKGPGDVDPRPFGRAALHRRDRSAPALSESDVAAVRAAIERVNQVKTGNDSAAIQQAIEDLQRASQAMSEHLHAATAPGNGAAAGGPSASSAGGPNAGQTDDVIDVEFEKAK